MAHTFVVESEEAIRTVARPAIAEYLKVNVGMQPDHSVGSRETRGFAHISERETEILIRNQVSNDCRGPLSFIGDLDRCAQQAETLTKHGVDEIACLIDFGIAFEEVMATSSG
jgi:hypothetical protein